MSRSLVGCSFMLVLASLLSLFCYKQAQAGCPQGCKALTDWRAAGGGTCYENVPFNATADPMFATSINPNDHFPRWSTGATYTLWQYSPPGCSKTCGSDPDPQEATPNTGASPIYLDTLSQYVCDNFVT